LQSRGVELSNIGVLMRVSALSRIVEEKLLNYNIAYKVSGIFKFFERLEVKNILAYLTMIVNPRDNSSITRIINYPKRGIGQATIDKLLEMAESSRTPLVELVENYRELDISSTIKNKIAEFGDLITRIKEAYSEKGLFDFVDFVVNESGIKGMYNTNSEEDLDRTMNIDQLLQSVKSFEHLNEGKTLIDYLESVTLQSALDEEDDNLPSVSISTVHASKGLEFDYVFIIGSEEGKFPLSRAMDSMDEMEEERRLMYVAITRARKKLYVTRAKSRFMYGKRESQLPSRFLKEMGLGVIETRSQLNAGYNKYQNSYSNSSYSNYSSGYSNSSYSNNQSGYSGYNQNYGFKPQINKIEKQSDFKPSTGGLGNLQNLMNNKLNNQKKSFDDYKVGVQVLHAKFGVGTIIKTDDAGGNNYVSVDFGTVGVKTLSLNFAPLQILKK